MSLKLPSDRSEFAGFDAYYASAIAPYLAERESERRRAVNLFFMICSAGIAAAVVLHLALRGLGAASLQFPLLLGFAIFAGAQWLLQRARNDIGHGLIYRIATKLGFSYEGAIERPEYYDRFKRLKMLPGHNRENWEDEVSGVYEGKAFTTCEAHLKFKTSGKNSSTRTVFHGQLFVIDYPNPFLGTTVILRDMGPLNGLMKPNGNFQRVGLVSSKFEKEFEAWSTDQVEARTLLDPVVLERFLELERLYGGRKIRAAYDGGKLLIAVESGDRLRLGSMFRPLGGPDRVEAILAEFDAIFDLIDVLLKPLNGPTAGAFSVADVR